LNANLPLWPATLTNASVLIFDRAHDDEGHAAETQCLPVRRCINDETLRVLTNAINNASISAFPISPG